MEAVLYSFFCLSLSALHAVGKALTSSLNESKEVGEPEKESIAFKPLVYSPGQMLSYL